MTLHLEGRLEDLGLAEILHVVGISRRSGELRVDARGREHLLLFQDGRIVAARHARGPRSMGDLLVKLGFTDAVHLAVLERQARTEGRSVLDLLRADGRLDDAELQTRLRGEIAGIVRALLDEREGSFSFELIDDVRSAGHDFGGVLLAPGIEPAGLPEVAGRQRAGGLRGLGLSLPSVPSRRQARLLISEDEISLPAPGRASVAEPVEAAEPEPAATESGVALVSLAAGPLRRAVVEQLRARGLEVETADSLDEVHEALAEAERQGRPVACVADGTHPACPGLEVLSGARSRTREARIVLLLGDDTSPGRWEGERARAERLGADDIVSVSVADRSESELAQLVAERLTAAPAPLPGELTPLEAAAGDASGLVDPEARPAPQRGRGELLELARRLGSASSQADVCREILGVVGEHLEAAVLLAAAPGGARAVGAFGPPRAVLADDLGARPDGDDPVSRVLQGGSSHAGVPAPGTDAAGVATAIGCDAELLVVPLPGQERPVGMLCGWAGPGRQPDLALLRTFLGDAAGALGRAAGRAALRGEARRVRLRA